MSEHQEHGAVVAVWAEHSGIGHHYEELLADGKVIAWTDAPPPGPPVTSLSATSQASQVAGRNL